MMSIVTMTDICKDYYQGKEPVRVLKNVNLTVERGDYLAIMGPSGSGKTTLMNLMGCLDVPTSGEYLLDGQNLKDFPKTRWQISETGISALCFRASTCFPKWMRWIMWLCRCCTRAYR